MGETRKVRADEVQVGDVLASMGQDAHVVATERVAGLYPVRVYTSPFPGGAVALAHHLNGDDMVTVRIGRA